MRTSTPRLVAVGIVILAACGGSSGSGSTDTTTPPPAQPAHGAERTPTPAPSPAPPPIEIKLLALVDANGVGLAGNDPVSYTTTQKPVPGTATHAVAYQGATYHFATGENKTKFEREPWAHAPQYGGYCAFAASQNRLSKSDPEVFLIHDGQLLMFTSRDFLARFQKDPAGHKQKADANWPGLVEQHGKVP